MTKPKKMPEGIRETSVGRYQARYTTTRWGVTRQLSAGTFSTIAEAKAARQVALVKKREGAAVEPGGPRMKVEAWVEQWAELTGTNDARTASFLRVHILPQWGQRRLGDIQVADVQMWVNALYSSHLSPTSAACIYATFKRIMARAVDYEKLTRTPCRLIKVPKSAPKKRVPLSRTAIDRIERNIDHRYCAMVHLAAWSGLRWQECAALHWEDVDLEAGMLHLHRAVKSADGKLGEPKNGKARDVVLPPSVVGILRAHRRDYGEHALVFTAPRGGLLNYSGWMTSVWRPAVKKSKLAPTGFHILRHAYVAHMVASGLDSKVISEQVGHHAASFTMDRYGWSRPDSREVIVAAVKKAQKSR